MQLLLLFCIFNLTYSFIPHYIHDISISGASLIGSKLALDNLKTLHLNQNVTRKLVHITSAPAFIATWQFYDSKYIAASVPILASLYLAKNSKSLSEIISRSGNNDEIFKGPLIYTIILSFVTLLYWKDDPIGLIAMNQLAIGDGFADLIGRKFGKNKWIFNRKKSIEGTIGFLITSTFSTYFLLRTLNLYENIHSYSLKEIFVISIACSLTETFSKIDDNISIPFAAVISNYFVLVFRYLSFIDPIINPVAAEYLFHIIHTDPFHHF